MTNADNRDVVGNEVAPIYENIGGVLSFRALTTGSASGGTVAAMVTVGESASTPVANTVSDLLGEAITDLGGPATGANQSVPSNNSGPSSNSK